ncbi:MAG: heparin lyase I family protein [Chitinophagaceae bacterium]|nr:heparin lyase I family protein [Chitinophagaceae bacterium]
MHTLLYQQKLSQSGIAIGLLLLAALMSFTCGSSASSQEKIKPFPADGLGAITGYGTLIYQNNFDTKASLVNDQLGEGSVSASVFKNGTGSFRSFVSGATRLSEGYRSEQQYAGSKFNPDEAVIEYDCYFENWKNFGHNNGHVVQWHPKTAGASAVLAIYAFEGKFEIVRNINSVNFYQADTLQIIIPNKWYHIRFEVKWSQDSTGYVRAFINDKLYYSYTGQTTDNSGTPYFKLGQNRWKVTESSAVYYDNLKIYKK